MKSEAVLLVTIVALFPELRQELELKLQAAPQLQWIVELRNEGNGGRAQHARPSTNQRNALFYFYSCASFGELLLDRLGFFL